MPEVLFVFDVYIIDERKRIVHDVKQSPLLPKVLSWPF